MIKKALYFSIALSIACAAYYYAPEQIIAPIKQFISSLINRTNTTNTNILEAKRTAIAPADLPASKTGVTLVFDLHGVLLGVDTKKAFNEIGLSKILKYSTTHGISFSQIESTLTEKVYSILDAIQPHNSPTPEDTSMPALVAAWQQGLKSNNELKALVFAALEQHPEWFTSDVEKQLVQQVITKMFTPEQLIATVKIIPEGLAFVQRCKEKGHTLIILSNWDPESFELLETTHPELFSLFDAIMVSGFTHHLKPTADAFTPLATRKEKYHETIILIDDQEENITAAQNVGIQGILCPMKTSFFGFGETPDFARVEKMITTLNP